MTEARLNQITHKKVTIHAEAVKTACRMWQLPEAQALDEIARIFLTGYFDKRDKQSILDILTLDTPETSRRIIIDRFFVVGGVSIGLPTERQLERRETRRCIRQKAAIKRKRAAAAAEKEEAAQLPPPSIEDFFSAVRAALKSADEIPSWEIHNYVRFTAFFSLGHHRQEVKGYVARFSDVSRLFETMRATRSRLPAEEGAACTIEATGQCGVDWLTYHQSGGSVEKRGKIDGQFVKGAGDALHVDG